MIVSADDYFMRDGVYKFDINLLQNAHAACFRRFMGRLEEGQIERVVILSGVPGSGKTTVARRLDGPTTLIVDNTNISAWQIAPYYLGAQSHGMGIAVEVMRVLCPPEVARARQTHDVPLAGHKRMSADFAKRDVLPWWKVSEVTS